MPLQLLVLKCCFLNAKKLWKSHIMISFLYLPMLNISYQAFENSISDYSKYNYIFSLKPKTSNFEGLIITFMKINVLYYYWIFMSSCEIILKEKPGLNINILELFLLIKLSLIKLVIKSLGFWVVFQMLEMTFFYIEIIVILMHHGLILWLGF